MHCITQEDRTESIPIECLFYTDVSIKPATQQSYNPSFRIAGGNSTNNNQIKRRRSHGCLHCASDATISTLINSEGTGAVRFVTPCARSSQLNICPLIERDESRNKKKNLSICGTASSALLGNEKDTGPHLQKVPIAWSTDRLF